MLGIADTKKRTVKPLVHSWLMSAAHLATALGLDTMWKSISAYAVDGDGVKGAINWSMGWFFGQESVKLMKDPEYKVNQIG